jgi:hypothetical protein
MTDKIKDKKIKGVSSAKETSGVQGAEAVTNVGGVKATQAVGGVTATTGVGRAGLRATRVMSAEERRKLVSMIQDEAKKMHEDGTLSSKNMEVVTRAVVLAVNASMGDDDEEDDNKQSSSKNKKPKK